jgi:hypothetical protein
MAGCWAFTFVANARIIAEISTRLFLKEMVDFVNFVLRIADFKIKLKFIIN